MVRWFSLLIRSSLSSLLFVSSLVVQFNGSFEWFGSSCRSVAGPVDSVIQSGYSACLFAVADQYSPAQITKHVSRLLGFFTNGARSI